MSELTILFGRPEADTGGEDRFELEALAAEALGIESYAISLDTVVDGDPERALRKLPRPRRRGDPRQWLYRGWMLTEDEYTSLYEAIAERGEELVVDPDAFAEATYAPNYLPLLGDKTAPARWTEGTSVREAWEVAQALGPPPWIVKDHVKSARDDWHRACFVPSGATEGDFAAVCEELLDARGDRFERGFVIKKYLELATIPGMQRADRPLTEEHRLVFWQGELVAHAPYDDVDATLEHPEAFAYLGRTLSSPFFTADVARLATGGMTIIEINDGGSSTLPEQLDPRVLYRALLK